jgi:branched-chain amino acid aminotransferase
MIRNSKFISYSRTWPFFQGQSHEGYVPIMGPRTHAPARLDRFRSGTRLRNRYARRGPHCARVNQSAVSFGLKTIVDLDMWGWRRMASVIACSSGNDVLFIYEAPIAR